MSRPPLLELYFYCFSEEDPKDETAMMELWERSTQYSFPLTQSTGFDTLGCVVRSYRFPAVSPLFLNAGPRKKCRHHLLLHCSLCREVHRESLFDRNRQFLSSLAVLSSRARLRNSTGSGSTERANHSSPAQAIHCTYCLTHCLVIIISGSVFVLIAER